MLFDRVGKNPDLSYAPLDGKWKYVRVSGVYRFCRVRRDKHEIYHAELVDVDERAESAGVVSIMPTFWTFVQLGSLSLVLHGSAALDVPGITGTLNKVYRASGRCIVLRFDAKGAAL